jgi:hypothetical protein
MKYLRKQQVLSILLLAVIILASACSSATRINSEPQGARLHLNGSYVGNTPYTHVDSRIVGSSTLVTLELDGYETMNTMFYRNEDLDVGALIGGLFFWPAFLWVMKYHPSRTFVMTPIVAMEPMHRPMQQTTIEKKLPDDDFQAKAEKLRELKKLFDEGVITQDEYEAEKKKVLEQHP